MSWTDRNAIRHIKQIRDIFNINTFVETGTYRGVNADVHSKNFDNVITIDIDEKYFNDYCKRCPKNVEPHLGASVALLDKDNHMVTDKKEKVIYYLDAHFYDPTLPRGRGKFVVLDELKALKGNKDCIIIIHDFDNNLGHITYDGINLDLKLLKKDLLNVNPKFKFYTNELASCDIIKPHETNNKYMKKDLKYVWSFPEKTYRGLLYCVPKKINVKGLKEII